MMIMIIFYKYFYVYFINYLSKILLKIYGFAFPANNRSNETNSFAHKISLFENKISKLQALNNKFYNFMLVVMLLLLILVKLVKITYSLSTGSKIYRLGNKKRIKQKKS